MGDDLGAGASGTVKKATHTPSGLFVAVKQIQVTRHTHGLTLTRTRTRIQTLTRTRTRTRTRTLIQARS